MDKIINDISPGYHPLLEAINNYNYEHAEFLLNSGSNPNQGTEPCFPVMQTDSNGDLEMIKLLEKYGVDWDHNIGVYEHWENQTFDIPYKKYERKTEA